MTINQPYANTTQATRTWGLSIAQLYQHPSHSGGTACDAVNVMVARDVSFENVFNLVE
ncbi:hypothetical protein LOK82_13605 [Xylella fastidiosa subsp. multiplex]|uniref:Uncharacterized protein n=1 Tax=Xylella fastidiosa subsp. multiplex TaxID=644357 RepID=A0AAW6HZ57_XYLFS|nr:hypothetical protein [Xylella fastidiosa subsp. multiplex]